MEAILKEATQLLSSVPSAKYTTLGKLESSFRTQILDPMVELYGKLSPSLRYHFINVISIYPQHMLERCTLKNVNTWDSVTKEDQVGRALQCLHPGICRAQSGVDWPSGDWPSTVIVKPVIVITNPEGRTDLHPGIRRAQSGVGWPSTVIVKPVIVITNPEGRPGIYI